MQKGHLIVGGPPEHVVLGALIKQNRAIQEEQASKVHSLKAAASVLASRILACLSSCTEFPQWWADIWNFKME